MTTTYTPSRSNKKEAMKAGLQSAIKDVKESRVTASREKLVPTTAPDKPAPAPAKRASTVATAHETKPRRADEMPLVSTFERADMDAARQLIEDDIAYQEQESAIKATRAAIKSDLAVILDKYKAPGTRFSDLVVYYNGMKSSNRFNGKKAKQIMVEYGIPAIVIQECYALSAPSLDLKIVDLNKPKKARGADEDEE